MAKDRRKAGDQSAHTKAGATFFCRVCERHPESPAYRFHYWELSLLSCRPIGEKDKKRRWKDAIKNRQDRVAHEVKFVPFCVEVGGAWGSAAKTFFNTCVALAGDDRDIDLYHWSSERFSAAWKTTISVLVAKGRARVGVAAAATDWPKRIRDLQFLDHEGDPTAA